MANNKKNPTTNTATGSGWSEKVKDGSTNTGYSTVDDRTNAWNTTVNEKINAAKAAGKEVYTFDDIYGMTHYTTNKNKVDSMKQYYGTKDGTYTGNANATYNMGGQTYLVNPQQQQTSYDTGYSSHKDWLIDTLSQQERIKSYYDEYLPAMMEGGKAQADKSYEANANAALNNRTEALRQQKENYIKNVMGKRNQLETARASKDAQLGAVNDDYFALLQQNREGAATRGLSNSGLMQALDQNIMSEANAQRAAIDQQYYANLNQLNREISTLVEAYGLNKAEADKIYNDTIQSLEAQRQNDYQRVVAEAQQKAIEYEFGVDSFNANAFNQAQQSKAELVNDAWKTKVNAETQITVAQIAADSNMSIAQLQDATDRWKASLDSDDKRWLAKFDRNTQIKIATLNNDARERLAQIEGSLGMAAAKYAANLEYQATMTGLNMQAGWQEKLIDAMKSAGYFGGSGGTGGGNFASPNLFETSSNMFAGVGGLVTAR